MNWDERVSPCCSLPSSSEKGVGLISRAAKETFLLPLRLSILAPPRKLWIITLSSQFAPFDVGWIVSWDRSIEETSGEHGRIVRVSR